MSKERRAFKIGPEDEEPKHPQTPPVLTISRQSGIRPSSVLAAHDKWMVKKTREIDRLRLRAIAYLREHGKDEWADEIEMVHYQQLDLRRENALR